MFWSVFVVVCIYHIKEHCPVYFNGCNACQCPDLVDDSVDDGADFCTNQVCPDGVEFGPTRTCFRCELSIMEYTLCGKCDRTCSDPSPNCLNDPGCIEKCECPLDRPIYNDGNCITEEECPIASVLMMIMIVLMIIPFNPDFNFPADTVSSDGSDDLDIDDVGEGDENGILVSPPFNF